MCGYISYVRFANSDSGLKTIPLIADRWRLIAPN